MKLKMKENNYYIVLLLICLNFKSELMGGSEWKTVYDSPSMNINCIKCADSLNCMATAVSYNYPYILKSSDGGKSWSIGFQFKVDYKNYYAMFNSLSYAYKNQCIVVCDTGIVFRSTDNGKSWERNRLSYEKDLRSITMYDSLTGMIIGRDALFLTRNGGEVWQLIDNNPIRSYNTDSSNYLEGVMLSKNRILVKTKISKSPQLYKIFISENSGNTWSNYDFPTNCEGNFLFTDTLTGWSVGGTLLDPTVSSKTTDKIIKTTDGGKTWLTVIDDTICQPYYPLKDISFNKNGVGIAVGKYGKILRTIDGGKTWIPEIIDFIQYKLPLWMNTCFAGDSTILITSQSGQIYRYAVIPTITEVQTELQTDIRIFPNPANDIIQINPNDKIEKIKLFSLLGTKLLESGSSESLNISSLTIGIYFLKINGILFKFIKN